MRTKVNGIEKKIFIHIYVNAKCFLMKIRLFTYIGISLNW